IEELAHCTYRLRLVPELWFLRHSVHSRVFVDLSVPDVIRRTLLGAGLPPQRFELHLTASSAEREHVCQYDQSVLDFVQGWRERGGLYYFFDYAQDGKLVVVDGGARHPRLREESVAYRPVSGSSERAGEDLRVFREALKALPGEIVTSDYNYSTPA